MESELFRERVELIFHACSLLRECKRWEELPVVISVETNKLFAIRVCAGDLYRNFNRFSAASRFDI